MKLDIQIVLYNSQSKLPHLLKSLKLAEPAFDFRLHFLQHDEFAGYDEIIKEFEFEYTLEAHTNIGFGAGHNYLFERYSAQYQEFFLVSNPDCIYFYEFFVNLEQDLAKYNSWGLIDFAQFPNEHPKPYDKTTLETPWCSASVLLVNTSTFRQLKGFDPLIFMYGEDVDLSWRTKYLGKKLLHFPNCRVGHYVGASSESEHGESPFAAKHMHAAELYLTAKFGFENSKGVEWIKNHSPYKQEAIKIYEQMKPIVHHPKADFISAHSLHAKRWQTGM